MHPSDKGKTAYSYDEFLKFSNGEKEMDQAVASLPCVIIVAYERCYEGVVDS